MATEIIFADEADGDIISSHSSYSTVVGGAAGKAVTNINNVVRVGQLRQLTTYHLLQAFVPFDTSELGAEAEIINVILSLALEADNTVTDLIALARLYDFGATIDTGDFRTPAQLAALTLLASFDTAGFSATDQYYDFDSEAAFADAIDTDGVTRMIIVSNRNESQTEPSGSEYFRFYSARQSGTTFDPKLTIETQDGATGSASFSLGGVDLSATGHRRHQGAASFALTGPSLAATGQQPHQGQAAFALEGPALSATGQHPHEGAGSFALSAPALAAAATPRLAGQAAFPLAHPGLSATGMHDHVGAGSFALAHPALAAAGQQPAFATAAFALAGPALAALGGQPHKAQATFALAHPELAATGAAPAVGTATFALAGPSLAASATQRYVGIAAFALGPPALAAQATQRHVAQAAFALAVPALSASAMQRMDGAAAFALGPPSLSASTLLPPIGAASFSLQPVALVVIGEGFDPGPEPDPSEEGYFVANVYGIVKEIGLNFTSFEATVTRESGELEFNAEDVGALLWGPDGYPYTIYSVANADTISITPRYRGATVQDSDEWALLRSQATGYVLKLTQEVTNLINTFEGGIGGAEWEPDPDPVQASLTFASAGNLSVSYDSRNIMWRRLGDMMFFVLSLKATPTYTTASGRLQITGLPLTGAAVDQPLAWVRADGLSVPNDNLLSAIVPAGSTTIELRRLASGNDGAITTAHLASGTALTLSVAGTVLVQ